MAIRSPKFDECEIKLAVGKRIRELREAKSYSQTLVADTIGMSPKYLSEIELGRRNLSFVNLVKLAMAFSVSLDDLLDIDATKPENKLKSEINKSVEHLQQALDSLKKISESV